MRASTCRETIHAAVVAALILGAAPPLAAQTGDVTQFELGAYGTFTRFTGSSLGLGNEFGAGGRLGYFVTPIFSIEASGDFTEANADLGGTRVTVARLAGSVVAQTRMGVYLGGGYERLLYRGGDDFDDNGLHLIVGDRFPLGGRAVFRMEGRFSYILGSERKLAGRQVINLSANAGLSILTFGGESRDSDGDGVRNDRDECPDTPSGALVNSVGCPSDSDTDGVLDGLDQCPVTPQGASVDAVGCPSDDDADGVFNGIDQCPNSLPGAQVNETGCAGDEDSDGVLDGIDQCPNTPAAATVDETGCPSDEDQDGVFDGIDQCPGTPAGVVVDEFGCPSDDDMDGVRNEIDQCPNTPPNVTVDEAGCPPQDTDNDGVNDSADRCPNTTPGRQVDAVGCPVLFAVEEGVTRALVLQGVNFATGSARLTPTSHSVLNEVAASLVANSDVRIEVAGHTDITGRRRTNVELSLRRAESVRQYLAQQGVALDRMVARGYGPDQPIATNSTRSGRAQNRRVELRRIEP
jgi:outer membrane protein OmpA-like peptidoglycan-associated protein